MRFDVFDLKLQTPSEIDIRKQLEAVIDSIDLSDQLISLFRIINDTPFLPVYGTNLNNILDNKNEI